MKSKSIQEYTLIKNTTEGTTGYLSCIPREHADVETVLRSLLSQPWNIFLRRYLLGILSDADFELLEEFLNKDGENKEIIGDILTEWSFSHVGETGRLQKLALQYSQKQPANPFAAPEFSTRQFLAKIFRDNLGNAQPLPENLCVPDACLPAVLQCCHNVLQQNFLEAAINDCEPVSETPPDMIKPQWEAAEKVLQANGLGTFSEMRHEASLSPIALLRDWQVKSQIETPSQICLMTGTLTSYGRGLTLAQARMSLRMEIIERASAFADLAWENGKLAVKGASRKIYLRQSSINSLNYKKESFYAPGEPFLTERYQDFPFYWFPGENSAGKIIWVPAQAVFLFCNLNEPAIFDAGGSNGLGAGINPAQARQAALLELVERDAAATTPVDSAKFVRICSRDKVFQSLLDDYRQKGIFPLFQDITTELGIPAWRCLVTAPDRIAQASAAALSSKNAIVSALTETPWPYSPTNWKSKKSKRPALEMPTICIEDLPDYDHGSFRKNLPLLEKTFAHAGIEAIYCEIGKADLKFPVCRAFLPGLETHAEFDVLHQPSIRLLARSLKSNSCREIHE